MKTFLFNIRKLNIFLSLMLLLLWLGAFKLDVYAAPRLINPKGDGFVIVIDPGHGGDNNGTEGHLNGSYLEKQMTMITSQALYDELSKYEGVTVYMTRNNDASLSLKERAEFAASVNADMMFSVHYNASVNHDLFGAEVWVPSDTPYHAHGYQFAMVELQSFKDKGLFIRGAKTKLNDAGENYYGIIREATALGVPAVIIEHCHVDNAVDIGYCDTDEDLRAFGVLDATSIAKYLGLKSSALGVDYSAYAAKDLASAEPDGRISLVFNTYTDPDVCEISPEEVNNETGDVVINVTAADYDDLLMYFDYSTDGGETFSERLPMPGYDYFNKSVQDSFEYTINLQGNNEPVVMFRVYNIFDRMKESNVLELAGAFSFAGNGTGENAGKTREEIIAEAKESKNKRQIIEKEIPGTLTFAPNGELIDEDTGFSLKDFLIIVLILVTLVFVTAFFVQLFSYKKRRKKRRGIKSYDYDIYSKDNYHY
ncbi:MAG: N-acetylmuramoyl-L-alanine amidase [Lachnospiraceae bacterium]|nr:N-acetylmuramoyl-L-alanine amidase [Lachnospiraceae bacterium]